MPVFPTKAIFAGICLALLPHAAAADPVYDLFDALFGPPLEDRAISQRHGRKHRGGHVAQFSGNMVASFYGGGERLNSHTANGERFHSGALTAAHRSLPFGTLLHVCYRSCTTVRVNDRGPAAWTGRSLDLSRGAARSIGMPGVARVNVSVLR
jgi:rare lipoprotein A